MQKLVLNVLLLLASSLLLAEDHFGSFATAIYLNKNETKSFYSCTGSGIDKISQQDFKGSLGSFKAKSSKLMISGAEIKSWTHKGFNVCGGTIYYIVYPSGNRPLSAKFSTISLPLESECSWFGNFENSEGVCSKGDRKWKKDNTNIDLTRICSGTYTLEIYFELKGSHRSSSGCESTEVVNNKGTNFKMNFTILPSEFDVKAYTKTKTINEGDDVQLFVDPVNPKDKFSYSWKGKTLNTSERNPIIKNIKTNQAGKYVVEVKNSCGEIQSETIELVVNKKIKPEIVKKNEKPIQKEKPKEVVKKIEKPIQKEKLKEVIKKVEIPKKEPKVDVSIASKPIVDAVSEIKKIEIITEKKENRNNELIEKINFNNRKIKLIVYDYSEDDGDLLTIFLNDKVIASEIEVKKDEKVFEFYLPKDKTINELVFVANNLGTIPPNTSKVDIYVDGKLTSHRLSTDNSKNALFIFEKK